MTGLLVTRALIVKTIKWRVIKDLMRCFYQNLTFDATIPLSFDGRKEYGGGCFCHEERMGGGFFREERILAKITQFQ